MGATQSKVDNVSADASAAVRQAGSILRTKLANNQKEMQRIAGVVGEPMDDDAASNTAALIWLDAMLVLNELNKAGVTSDNTANCRDSNGKASPQKIEQAWRDVLATNYMSVFQPACAAFPKGLSSAHFADMFTVILDAVDDIEKALLGRTSSIAGEIYAKILTTDLRKNTAAFYTRLEAADFLARLTMPDSSFLPKGTDAYKQWRLADFACGTGTLLRAAYRRLRDFTRAAGVSNQDMHAHVMSENGFCGFDISPIGVHLTATNLVTMQPDTKYQDTNIGVIKIGEIGGVDPQAKDWKKVRAGSIEMLDKDTTLQKLPLLAADFSFSSVKVAHGKTEGAAVLYPKAEDESFDAVLMNPPYSGVHGGKPMFDFPWLDEWERVALQDRTKRLTRNSCSNLKAGLGTTFLAIADRKLKTGGKLGMVLPITIAGTSEWLEARKLLESGYSDVTVVFFAGGSGGGENAVSADTAMGECMLSATKGDKGADGIAYVCLDEYFGSRVEAIEIAKVVAEERASMRHGDSGVLYVGGEQVGRFLVDKMGGRVWGAAGVSSLLDLAGKAQRMVHGEIEYDTQEKPVVFDVKKLEDIFTPGSTHDKIGYLANHKSARGVFEFHEIAHSKPSSPDLCLWSPKHLDKKIAIKVEPTHHGTKRKNITAAQIQQIQAEKSDLFYCRTIRWTYQKVLAPQTTSQALGGRGFLSLTYEGENADTLKYAFTVWANSIFGFVSHWYQTGKQSKGRSPSQVEDTRNLLIPDFTNQAIVARTQKAMKQHPDPFTQTLQKCNNAATDPHRIKLGEIAAQILGIPVKHRNSLTLQLSNQWATEPTVN